MSPGASSSYPHAPQTTHPPPINSTSSNRDILSVILGGFGTRSTSKGKTDMSIYEGEHKEITLDGCVEQLNNAESVIIVPGYGLAVAKAQVPPKRYNVPASWVFGVSAQLRPYPCLTLASMPLRTS